MSCNETDFMFPMLADVYYATAAQGPYGGVLKTWTLDKTIVGNFTYAGSKTKEELDINIEIMQESLLIGRIKSDLRISSNGGTFPMTNILITNIRNCNGTNFYLETSGPRDGKSTLFELATQQPFINPFGKTEHYRLILRRSENQGDIE